MFGPFVILNKTQKEPERRYHRQNRAKGREHRGPHIRGTTQDGSRRCAGGFYNRCYRVIAHDYSLGRRGRLCHVNKSFEKNVKGALHYFAAMYVKPTLHNIERRRKVENHMKRYFIEFGSAMSLYAVVLISVIHWRDSLPNHPYRKLYGCKNRCCLF